MIEASLLDVLYRKRRRSTAPLTSLHAQQSNGDESKAGHMVLRVFASVKKGEPSRAKDYILCYVYYLS